MANDSLFSFIYYILTLFFYVVLPLPTITANFCAVYHATATPQLHPFQFVNDIEHETAGYPLLEVLTSQSFLQVVFNLLLFVPLGVYLRYYYRRSFPLTIGIAFATSLGLELTQYTGIWHLYPCAYRLFDVDDLLLNTLGAVIGAGLISIASFLPSMQPKRMMTQHHVSIFRRLLAWITDAIVVSIGTLLLMAIIFSLLINYTSTAWINPWVEKYGSTIFSICVFVSAFITFVLIAIFSNSALLHRSPFLPSPFFWLLVIIYVLPVLFRSDRQSLGGLLSHTHNVAQNGTGRHHLLSR